ncbi:phosphatidate cytidylyltransferase [bacterium]|nr:phosphatidate cytidylyltransferase [bacterium]
MGVRIFWGLLLGFVFLLFTLQSLPFVLFCVGCLHFAAQYEFASLIARTNRPQLVLHAALTTAVWLVAALALTHRLPLELLAVALLIVPLVYAMLAVRRYTQPGEHRSFLTLIKSLLFITLPMAFVPALLVWDTTLPYLLLLIGASWAADTGAIFAGKLTGRTPLAPLLSPKKTVEGAVGGALAAGLVWTGAVLIYPLSSNSIIGQAALPQWVVVLIAFLVGSGLAVIGMFGDLTFSLYKREQQVKDYSSLIPGHGGVLDRCDSMLFVAPLLYLICFMVG